MQLQDIHQLLTSISADEICCGIRLDWVASQTADQIVKAGFSKVNFETNDAHINMSMDFNFTDFKMECNAGRIIMKGFKPRLLFVEKQSGLHQQFRWVEIQYADLELLIKVMDEEPKLLYKAEKVAPTLVHQQFTVQEKLVFDQLLQASGLTEQDYDLKERVLLMANPFLAILDGFLKMIKIPNCLSSLVLVKLVGPYRYETIDDPGDPYMLVIGKVMVKLDTDCDCKFTSVQRIETRSGSNVSIAGNHLNYPASVNREVTRMQFPSIFYYIPKQTFEILKTHVFNPAIVASDKGEFFLFNWEWKLSANFLNANLTLDPQSKSIFINSSHRLEGDANVGIQIACVYTRLASVGLDGMIDNARTTLNFLIDDGNNLVLHCEYKFDMDVDLSGLFVFDLLLNPILDSVLNRLIKDKYESRLKLFNTNFLDLNKFTLPEGFKSWEFAKSIMDGSLCIGIQPGKD